MATRRVSGRGGRNGKKTAQKKNPAQEALQVTWLLKGKLKSEQMAYLRIGQLLVKVRDEKLYEKLKHPDMATYAHARLKLRKTSLYRYLQVYDWVRRDHPEWLVPHPKGYIPVLNDAVDLMWIEDELKLKKLNPEKRAALEILHLKALSGDLEEGELAAFRRQGHGADQGLKSFLSTLRRLRKRGFALAHMPAEAIADLDAAIEVVKQAVTGSIP